MADNKATEHAKSGTQLETPGEALRKARKEQDKSLKQVSEDLHLDRWILEAIERDDYSALGAPVFAKGHLKQYAKLLKLEIDDLMVAYYQVSGSREAPPLLAESVLRAEGRVERNFSWIWPTLLALIVILGIGYAIYLYLQPTEEPASVASGLDLGPDAGADIPTPIGADGSMELTLVPATVQTTASESESEVSTEDAGLLLPMTDAEAAGQTEEAEPIVSKNMTVALRFSEESWVEVYDAKRQKLLYGLVDSAAVKYLSGPPPFSVFLGRQNAVSVEVNGAPFEIPREARKGNTARFQINKP